MLFFQVNNDKISKFQESGTYSRLTQTCEMHVYIFVVMVSDENSIHKG